MKLAFELVRLYHSEQDANEAEKYFVNTFSRKETPTSLSEFKPIKYDVISVLVETKLVSSRSEARRVVQQGGVKINGATIEDSEYVILPNSILKKGKIDFIKIL